MSESTSRLHRFGQVGNATAIALSFDLEALIADWAGLRGHMTRDVPTAFTRDEWAHMASFVAADALFGVYTSTFGPICSPGSVMPTDRLLRSRGPVALWLPNNVSLLGPLTLVLVSLTGNPLWVKAGSRSDDLCTALLEWVLAHSGDGPLRRWLEKSVQVVQMARDDRRQAEWSENASARIVFGSDAGADAVAALPARPTAPLFAFVDKQSQAWAEPSALDDEALLTLIRVFAIYGRAGCTSPARLVLIGGSDADCQRTATRLLELWPQAVRGDVDMHRASDNVMSWQVARAWGWQATLAPRRAAVICVGETTLDDPPGDLVLPVVCASLDQAAAALPDNAQTIGHLVSDPTDARWVQALAGSPACRFVPVAQMHHFGPVWDGVAFWRQLFEEVEVAT